MSWKEKAMLVFGAVTTFALFWFFCPGWMKGPYLVVIVGLTLIPEVIDWFNRN